MATVRPFPLAHRTSLTDMPQDPRVYPSLEEVITILETSTSSPSTLAPPSDTTYPSSSAPTSSTPHATGAKPNLVPVYQEIPADLLTPVAAYLKVASESEHSFLLESVVAGENLARYSFVGAGELRLVHANGSADARPGQDGAHGRGL